MAAKADCAHFSLFYYPIKIIESSFKQYIVPVVIFRGYSRAKGQQNKRHDVGKRKLNASWPKAAEDDSRWTVLAQNDAHQL